MPNINWNSRGICIMGHRGAGKTTLICQHLLKKYPSTKEALYFSADNIYVASHGLFAIAQEYFKYGGQALFIDEAHKYPNWSTEIKNILDTYKNRQIVFSASSAVELQKSKADLSRRLVYYTLQGLSFREYLHFKNIISLPAYPLTDLLKSHIDIALQLKKIPILRHFHDYLAHGYFPFFLEEEADYLSKLNNVIEKIIFEDIAVVYNLKQSTITALKKILWLVATSKGLIPNIDAISKDIQMSREVIYDCFEYLHRAGLINNVYPLAQGGKLIRKPGKVFLENSNLLYAINGSLNFANNVGNIRESFFVNQCSNSHSVILHDTADFIIDKQYVIEVGGKSKKNTQIKNAAMAYLAVDNIEIGFGQKIPLYLFGLLY